MKVIAGFGLVLILVSIGCRETAMPFETIDEIGVLERADLHGQLGHLIQVKSSPNNDRGGSATTVYAKVFDRDISDAPYFLQWQHISVRADDYISTIADVLGRAEGLALVDKPNAVPFFEEVVIGKPNTTAKSVTHCLKVTTADGVRYIGVHIIFTDEVKAWFATKLSQPLRMLLLAEKEDEPPHLLLSMLPAVVSTAVVKDTDGSLSVALHKDVVAASPVSNDETLTLAAYSRDVLDPPPPTTAPPAITTLTAVSDNTDTSQAMAGDTVTLTFSTNKPIVLQRSRVSFVPTNGSHGRVIKAVAGATNQYTSDFLITEGMSDGMLQVRVTLVDSDGNTSGVIVRNTGVTINQPAPPPVADPPVVEPPDEPSLEPLVHADPQHWRASTDKASRWLTSYSNSLHGLVQKWDFSDDDIFERVRSGLGGFLGAFGIDGFEKGFGGIDFILELYAICVEERPEIAADAVKTGIVIYPIVGNRLVFDWVRLGVAYPEKTSEERWHMFRQLVRFWGTEGIEDWWWRTDKIGINEVNRATFVPERSRVYVQPPDVSIDE